MLKSKTCFYLGLIGLVFLGTEMIWAKPLLGEIKPGIYEMHAITNHTPALFKKDRDYWKSFQKVELAVGNQQQFKDLPALASKNPFTGFIKLGDQPQKFGVIVDIAGEEKRLYIDHDGDGSFSGENWMPLLNEWLGIENYWVIGPEPVKVEVKYKTQPNRSYPLELSVIGFLNRPGAFATEKPYLSISVRTWFLTNVIEDGAEKLVAVCDHNNNGCFNDKEDQLLIDYNDDGFFSQEEAILRKSGVKIKDGKERLTVNWDVYPVQLLIGGKNHE